MFISLQWNAVLYTVDDIVTHKSMWITSSVLQVSDNLNRQFSMIGSTYQQESYID